MTISQYLEKVNARYRSGISREHAYRGDLQQLLEQLLPGVLVTNEPARIECGAPDYVLTRKDVPIGYIEAKDIGCDFSAKSLQEQLNRYKAALDNLILTDYLDFHFIQKGEPVASVSIGQVLDGSVISRPDTFTRFTALIENFALHASQNIRSPTKLAEMMAAKAKLMAQVIERALSGDEQSQQSTELKDQFAAFKSVLIHDIDNRGFADIYAQTIAYGLFAARFHDPSLPTFSRQEASELVPKSNPFLRKLFHFVAGPDLDNRIAWIVDELVSVFLAADVAQIMRSFGRSTQQQDPIIHFYETFLANYDADLRKARGVWYTPEPVVSFIVRAVDEVLRTKFELPSGLSDSSKIEVTRMLPNKTGRMVAHKEEVHRVQVLDPATGTGTFLAETIRFIHSRHFKTSQGIWANYVRKHLIPRLNGFELLMTSYAMAHLKLDMLLNDSGYKLTSGTERLNVYLTNSLEEHHPDTGTLFASWLSAEANEANHIKRDSPVMVVMGNPPYSGISLNNGAWITSLIEDYKYVDGIHFNERKHWLNDDYVKFIRYAQHFIEKNGSGIIAFITPHGFLDNPTFRGMRWQLLQAFDEIYTVDLHGNPKKGLAAADGGKDENVFDITQGVAISVFVKTGAKKKGALARVFHHGILGDREAKYAFLKQATLQSIPFSELSPQKPLLFFVPTDEKARASYDSFIGIEELFPINTMGFVSANDALNISFEPSEVRTKIADLLGLSESAWRLKYKRKKDARDWAYLTAKEDAQRADLEKEIVPVAYRPFDTRFSLYTGNSRGLYASPQAKIMTSLMGGGNVALVCVKRGRNADYHNYFVSDACTDKGIISSLDNANVFPLFVGSIGDACDRNLNLRPEVLARFTAATGLTFRNDTLLTGSAAESEFSGLDVFDYVYACLHSRAFRDAYKEQLKTDFPRVPLPSGRAQFKRMKAIGGRLRRVHLLADGAGAPRVGEYPEDGDNIVVAPRYKDDRVYINEKQYFANIPEAVWRSNIGGYQPALKWLKDRKGRALRFEDVNNYQMLLGALAATERLVDEVDAVGTSAEG